MSRIALIYNNKSPEGKELLLQVASHVKAKGGDIVSGGDIPGFRVDRLKNGDFSTASAAIVFGGDGTMLTAVRHLAPMDIPLFGINMGKVGFLSSAEKDEAFHATERLLAGDYTIHKRMLIKCQLHRQEKIILECQAFNDFVVSSGVYSRAVNLELTVDGSPIHSYNADGVIVSTPTGSTGYSLSAGGPIVMANMDMLLITPVCAHSFFSRPIIASAESTVGIICYGAEDKASLTADGQYRISLCPGDKAFISREEKKANIIEFDNQASFFDRIKNKLYSL